MHEGKLDFRSLGREFVTIACDANHSSWCEVLSTARHSLRAMIGNPSF